jgi:hypothetical protein
MMPFMNAGPDSGFAQIDFAQMYLDQMNRDAKGRDQRQAQNKELVDAGIVSTLDLVAPNRAVEEYNHANTCTTSRPAQPRRSTIATPWRAN